MINVAALTSGINTPSARFRVRQHINSLNKAEINVVEFPAKIEKTAKVPWIGNTYRTRYIFPLYFLWELTKLISRVPDIIRANRSDIVWLQRELISGLVTLEFFIKKPYVFDVDDAIWTSKPFGRYFMAKIAKRAAVVVVGNEYLANWFSQYAKKLIIIPTAIDTNKFRPSQVKIETNKFIIGWTGIESNLSYLYSIEDALFSLIQKNLNMEIHIVSDGKPNFRLIPDNRVKYIQWSPENEAVALQSFDIGLMPLIDNEFTRGKCSFKMLQYMSTGLPVVVSPIGMNADVMKKAKIGFSASSLAEWYEAMYWLYSHPEERILMGEEGRKIVEDEFSQVVVSKKIEHEIINIINNQM